jgi:hypothetical protein
MSKTLFIHVIILLMTLSSSRLALVQLYLFYLHGRIVEDQGPEAVDTIHGFGVYRYEDILSAFRKENFIVISEVRQKNTDVEQYAKKLIGQIDSLLQKGIPAINITVVGASKGAAIAMLTSSMLKNKDVNFVFMAGCNDDNFKRLPQIDFCGNILSIYERTDDIGKSCTPTKNLSQQEIPHYKEIELNTGLKHGFLFKPLPEWVEPAVRWAEGNYQ